MKFFRALNRLIGGGCAVDAHEPIRKRIRIDGGDFRSTCRNCGTRIVRYGTKDWRVDERAIGQG